MRYLQSLTQILTRFKHSLKKQFGFQEGHSTDHAILQLEDQIRNNLDQNNFTLRVFSDLSKAFNTVDHKAIQSNIFRKVTKKKQIYFSKL